MNTKDRILELSSEFRTAEEIAKLVKGQTQNIRLILRNLKDEGIFEKRKFKKKRGLLSMPPQKWKKIEH